MIAPPELLPEPETLRQRLSSGTKMEKMRRKQARQEGWEKQRASADRLMNDLFYILPLIRLAGTHCWTISTDLLQIQKRTRVSE